MTNASDKPGNDPSAWLKSRGWLEQATRNPWRWWRRGYPGVFYRKEHAIRIQLSLDRANPKNRSANIPEAL